MKVAWVSPYVPAPVTTGGAIRQHRLAEALAARAEVHLFARGEFWEASRLCRAGPFATAWVGRDVWHRSSETGSMRVRRGSPRSLYRAIRELHRRSALDLVVVAHSWASLGAAELGLPWLLDEHNVESRYFAEMYRAQGQSGARVEREISEIARWERRAWASCTALSCVSVDDAATIAEHAPARAPVVVPNGAAFSRAQGVAGRRGGVLFVGSMHHAPNVDAARRLIERILPRVWAESPDVVLTVVGGPVPASLARSGAHANGHASHVTLAGVVPDVRPYLEEARVFANPLAHGAGSSLKIAEALAAGIPIVSSDLGVRGFDLVPGRDYLSANTDEEHARAIARVLIDPDLAARLSRAARAAGETYGWAALGQRFVDLALATTQK